MSSEHKETSLVDVLRKGADFVFTYLDFWAQKPEPKNEIKPASEEDIEKYGKPKP